ncbi:MAG: OmpA family protein [Elusimicrobia bacterium]|nr:OmpA family protein [Elusimicrobiota bacterium]
MSPLAHRTTALALCLAGASLAACARARARGSGRDSGAPRPPVPAEAAAQPGPGEVEAQEEASLRGKDYRPVIDLARIHFGYDRAELSSEARRILERNARWLAAHPRAEVQIQGHCDQRGTTEYNIALGQRRASVIRDYYKGLGVPLRRMSTIGYGEELPECEESTETCWRRNRRGVTLIRR